MSHKSRILNHKSAFTLIELIIVIVIMGIVTALIATNLYASRTRALDSQKKSNLRQLKTALLLYNTHYHKYPLWTNGLTFNACGNGGTNPCNVDYKFTADGVEYLSKLVKSGSYYEFRYYSCNTQDDFRIKVTLSNTSDPDLAGSRLRCPASTCAGPSLNFSASDYVLCAN